MICRLLVIYYPVEQGVIKVLEPRPWNITVKAGTAHCWKQMVLKGWTALLSASSCIIRGQFNKRPFPLPQPPTIRSLITARSIKYPRTRSSRLAEYIKPKCRRIRIQRRPSIFSFCMPLYPFQFEAQITQYCRTSQVYTEQSITSTILLLG